MTAGNSNVSKYHKTFNVAWSLPHTEKKKKKKKKENELWDDMKKVKKTLKEIKEEKDNQMRELLGN